jgi:hypothetical protein
VSEYPHSYSRKWNELSEVDEDISKPYSTHRTPSCLTHSHQLVANTQGMVVLYVPRLDYLKVSSCCFRNRSQLFRYHLLRHFVFLPIIQFNISLFLPQRLELGSLAARLIYRVLAQRQHQPTVCSQTLNCGLCFGFSVFPIFGIMIV